MLTTHQTSLTDTLRLFEKVKEIQQQKQPLLFQIILNCCELCCLSVWYLSCDFVVHWLLRGTALLCVCPPKIHGEWPEHIEPNRIRK